MGLKKNCSWIRIERHFPSLCLRYRHCHNSITLLERRHESGGRWLLTRPTPGPGIRCWQQDFGTLRASCSNENWGEMNEMDEAEIAVPMKLLKNARNRCTQTLRFYLSWVALSPFWWGTEPRCQSQCLCQPVGARADRSRRAQRAMMGPRSSRIFTTKNGSKWESNMGQPNHQPLDVQQLKRTRNLRNTS